MPFFSSGSTLGDSVDGSEIILGSEVLGDLMKFNGSAWARFAVGNALEIPRVNAAGDDLEFNATMAKLEFIATGTGTTPTSVGELWTHTFTAGDLAATDLLVVFQAYMNGAGGTSSSHVRIADGTNTFTSTNISPTNSWESAIHFLKQGLTNTDLSDNGLGIGATGVFIQDNAAMIANWLTSGFTISGRGHFLTSGQFQFWIFKMRGA